MAHFRYFSETVHHCCVDKAPRPLSNRVVVWISWFMVSFFMLWHPWKYEDLSYKKSEDVSEKFTDIKMLKYNYRYCTFKVSQLRRNFSNPIYLSQVNLNSSYLYLYFAEGQNWARLQNLWTKCYDVWFFSKSSLQSNSESFSQKCDPGFHDII